MRVGVGDVTGEVRRIVEETMRVGTTVGVVGIREIGI